MKQLNEEQFEKNPSLFLEQVIKEYVAASPDNRLTSFDDEPIFDEPLIGFADGDDAIFQDYKSIIGDFHLTPREALAAHRREKGGGDAEPANVSVISFVMPITYQTRLSLRRETRVPSLRWNHTRWQGQDLINKLANHLVSLLEELGYQAAVPEQADYYKVFDVEGNIRISNFSHRHHAYAAGLGTFSLNDGFITPRGIAMRLGTVITDAVLLPTPRVYENHLINCLYYRDKSCTRCMERCPAGAIGEQGHDKAKCREFLTNGQAKEMASTEGYMGRYLGCGLCQTKVPCESQIPPSSKK
ncbi:epoxyqueuosine reductase [Chloroflexota bacterium]